jgi:hypothetical protein
MSVNAQPWKNTIVLKPYDKPLDNPYQFPNYYQNNSSYTNNSMQNNKPTAPRTAPYTGNADYIDPARINIVPYIYGNTTIPSIGTGASTGDISTTNGFPEPSKNDLPNER